MTNHDKFVEKLYSETDSARSIATSGASIVGLDIYLMQCDWVIAAFSAVIVFPIARLTSARINEGIQRAEKRRTEREEAEEKYDQLGEHEKPVVQAFVQAGGAVLTWSHVNALYLRLPAIVSLIHHHFLSTEDTADGMIETFVPNSELFPTGVEKTKLLIYLTLHILGVYSARPLLGNNLSSKLMSRLRFDLSGDWHNKPL